MTLITFLPHTPFKKKNVLSFLICIVISMGKVEKVNVLYKNAIYGCCVKTPRFFISKIAFLYENCGPHEERPRSISQEHGQNEQKRKSKQRPQRHLVVKFCKF